MSACLKAATTLFQDVSIAFIDGFWINETKTKLVLHIERCQSAVKNRHPQGTHFSIYSAKLQSHNI